MPRTLRDDRRREGPQREIARAPSGRDPGTTMRSPGGVPERPKGTGCKPVGSAYGGSNPPAPTLCPRWCGPSVEVEVHAGQDQRPENRRDQGRDDVPDAVEVRPVVMRGRHDAAGDEIDEQQNADPWPGSRCRGWVVRHSG